MKKNKQVIFHGGCLGCVAQENAGLGYCVGCKYFECEWHLPDKSMKPDDGKVESARKVARWLAKNGKKSWF